MLKKISALLLGVFILSIIGVFTMNSEEMADKSKKKEVKSKNPRYEISVTQKGNSLGKIVVELFPDKAPKHCKNFDELVAAKAYDGTAFHRVIPGFMIQGGDPNSINKPRNTWGMGDPSQKKVPAEFNDIKHVPGILSAARSQDINSASSQFFIMDAAYPSLDGQYSAFGHVITGMDVVKKIINAPRDSNNNPNDKIEMKIIKLK